MADYNSPQVIDTVPHTRRVPLHICTCRALFHIHVQSLSTYVHVEHCRLKLWSNIEIVLPITPTLSVKHVQLLLSSEIDCTRESI